MESSSSRFMLNVIWIRTNLDSQIAVTVVDKRKYKASSFGLTFLWGSPCLASFFILQVKKEEGQKLQAQKSFSVSRRDATIFLAAQTLSAVTSWSLEPPAEARLSRSEIKKQILEKLEQLREKAGISKPKDDKEENPSPQPPPGKVEKLQTPQSSAKFLEDPVGALMEVIVP